MNTVESLDAILCELADVANEIERYAQNPRPSLTPFISGTEDTAKLAVVARHLLDELFAREEFFPDFAVSEPSWLILLDMYIWAVAGRSVMMGEACLAARVPSTTALRHVAALVARACLSVHPQGTVAQPALVTVAEPAFGQAVAA